MPIPLIALALALPLLQAAQKQPPPCTVLAAAKFGAALVLTEHCYVVKGFFPVSAPVTIEPGTTITFAQGSALTLTSGGSIHAVGTAEKPIVLRGQQHTPGFWVGISYATNSTQNVLSYVTVEDAGSKSNTDDAAIRVGTDARLAIDHTTIRNAPGNGLVVLTGGLLSRFEANRFENDGVPVSVKVSDLAVLDAATTFSHNQHEYVFVQASDLDLERDATWHSLAVPYHFDNTPSIKAQLTIDPGARLEFREKTGINVKTGGSLTAEGTAAKPIVFTGAEQAPGFWDGVDVESNSPKNVFRNTIIQYAGAVGGVAQAGLCVFIEGSATVQNSEIAFSPTAGVRIRHNASLNGDAAASNRMHDNAANIVREP